MMTTMTTVQEPLTASQSLVFVRPITAVVLSVTDPPAADAASVVTRELVAVARPVRMQADLVRLVARISAVVFTVAVPPCRDAAVSRLAAKIIYTHADSDVISLYHSCFPATMPSKL